MDAQTADMRSNEKAITHAEDNVQVPKSYDERISKLEDSFNYPDVSRPLRLAKQAIRRAQEVLEGAMYHLKFSQAAWRREVDTHVRRVNREIEQQK